MSLLHEALKKAEKEKGELPPGEAFVDQEEEKNPAPIRLYLLIALTVASLCFAVYLQIFRKNTVPSVAKTTPTPLGIAGGPGVADLGQQADASLHEGRWDEAEKLLEKLVILEPRNPEAYNNLGVALKRLGKREKAYEQYKKALAIEADYPPALNNLGVLYLADGKLPEAALQFQKGIQVKPDYAEPYFHLAMIEEAEGKAEEARKNYQKFIDLSPQLEAPFLLELRHRVEQLTTS